MSQVNLTKALQRLHRLNGEPSRRELARRTHGALSHSTVSKTIGGQELPSWRSLELVVSALEGDLDEFRSLWIAARDAQEAPNVSTKAIVDASVKETSDGPVKETPNATRRFLVPDGNIRPAVASAVNKSRLLQRNNNKYEALAFLEQWQSEQPINSAVVFEMASLVGEIMIRNGRYSDLIEEVIQDGHPETAESALWLANECKERGNESKRLLFLTHALHIEPRSVRALSRLGEYYYDHHDLENTVRFFLRAFALSRDSVPLYSLVNALCMLGRAPEAARICEEMYRDKGDFEIVDLWASSLFAMDEYDDAMRILRLHMTVKPEERPAILVELGQILCHIGRFEEAEKVYQELLKIDPDTYPYERSYALAGLAYINLNQDNRSDAVSMLDQVLAMDPGTRAH